MKTTTLEKFTLRNEIEKEKEWHRKYYGTLDWRWYDEGLIWTLLDYHSSVGSLLDFTEDDWTVCKENGITPEMAAWYCED